MKDGYSHQLESLKTNKETITAKSGKVKRIRVGVQQDIADHEKKIEALNLDPDLKSGDDVVAEGAERVDLDEKENMAKDTAASIL